MVQQLGLLDEGAGQLFCMPRYLELEPCKTLMQPLSDGAHVMASMQGGGRPCRRFHAGQLRPGCNAWEWQTVLAAARCWGAGQGLTLMTEAAVTHACPVHVLCLCNCSLRRGKVRS